MTTTGTGTGTTTPAVPTVELITKSPCPCPRVVAKGWGLPISEREDRYLYDGQAPGHYAFSPYPSPAPAPAPATAALPSGSCVNAVKVLVVDEATFGLSSSDFRKAQWRHLRSSGIPNMLYRVFGEGVCVRRALAHGPDLGGVHEFAARGAGRFDRVRDERHSVPEPPARRVVTGVTVRTPDTP